jgi:tRNA pseudouridine55 synthase
MTSKKGMMKNNLYTPLEGKILAINKPENWTSFDVVNKVRRLTRIKKVGHAGTLDPFATGVLLICLGPATKQSSALMNLTKEYVAEIELGSETDTMDLTGQVISESPVPPLMENQIHNVLLTFTGSIDQEIPAYSAAKFRGKRLYKMARKGLEVPRLSKKVDIHHIDLLDWGENFLKIRISCGRGTYIRTLARDIARSLKTTGHLKTLIRTRVGNFGLEDCLTIEELQAQLKISNANDS